MLPFPAAATELWGHAHTEQTLLGLALSGRMPHGWIFTGPAGVGKATLAFRFARFLLYRGFSPPENQNKNSSVASLDLFSESSREQLRPTTLAVPLEAPVFAQVAAGSHPDLLVIAPDEDARDLSVEQIRAVPPFLAKTAALSGWRIVIIDGAERMNRAAQNALLKVLEEPSANSLLLLLSENLGKLLPTIRSRSRVLRLAADADRTPESLSALDPRISGLTSENRNRLWHMAGQAPGQMLQLLDQDVLTTLQHLLDYAAAPDAIRADELARGFAGAPQFQAAARALGWLLHQIACGDAMGLPSVRMPELLKFHQESETMLAETAQLNLDGVACWHELLTRFPRIFERP